MGRQLQPARGRRGPSPRAADTTSWAAPTRSAAAGTCRAMSPITTEQGVGSWYGNEFHGRKTANGEIYDMNALTAAHPTLPMPSYAYVTNLRNGRTHPGAHQRSRPVRRRSRDRSVARLGAAPGLHRRRPRPGARALGGTCSAQRRRPSRAGIPSQSALERRQAPTACRRPLRPPARRCLTGAIRRPRHATRRT